MATEMSTINFVGVDISPIYPTAIFPRNCNFYNEDFVEGVSQPDGVFDVVFQRNVTCGFTFEHWQKAMKEAFRVLKPGGYYECVESDITVENAGPQTNVVFEHLRMSMAARSVDPSIVRSLDRLMAAAGFKDIQVKEYMIPVGEWGGKVGQLWKQNMFAILDTVRPQLAKAARISESQVQEIVNAMHQETVAFKSHQIIYVTYGRKPL
jgi:SAM-dependent methyltransferase